MGLPNGILSFGLNGGMVSFVAFVYSLGVSGGPEEKIVTGCKEAKVT